MTVAENTMDKGFTFYERLVCNHRETSLWQALLAGKQG
jgi:hypothetical protein